MYEVDCSNAYQTREFDEYRAYYQDCFSEDNQKEQEEKQISYGYRIKSMAYVLEKAGCELLAYRQWLLAPDGQEIFSWLLYDNHDFLSFSDVIMHSDEEMYLIYKECLYGYSVLRLRDLASLHYVPRGFAAPGKLTMTIGESFIMTDFYYSADNDMLAANGCFWACPGDVVIIDFRHPLAEPKLILSCHQLIDPEYENDDLEEIDFKAWNGDTLIVQAGNAQEFIYPVKELREMIMGM